jgi:hypothetical protein
MVGFPQFQWDRGRGFGGFNETAEEDSAVSMRPRKRIRRFQWDRGSGVHNFNKTAESFKKLQQHNFSSEIKLCLKKFLFRLPQFQCESGSRWLMKNRGSKISWHCPFKKNLIVWKTIIIQYMKWKAHCFPVSQTFVLQLSEVVVCSYMTLFLYTCRWWQCCCYCCCGGWESSFPYPLTSITLDNGSVGFCCGGWCPSSAWPLTSIPVDDSSVVAAAEAVAL